MKKIFVTTVFILLITISTAFGSCSEESTALENSPTTEPSSGPAGTVSTIEQSLLADMSQVVATIRQSVVAIDVEATAAGIFGPTTIEGAGSGWIVDSDGYIVTNNHVVEGADTVTITLGDGRVFPADTVNTDSLSDLAVVKIDADNLTAAPVGDSDKLDIGNWAIAIGNSLGMGISATVGVVSALDVSLQEEAGVTLHGLIQTDAAINPGNSGGPLVNASGEVIGINSIKVSQVGVEGMGYAISINEALPIIQTLISQGYVVRPWLGINTIAVNDAIAARYNLPVNRGALILNIVTGGPADQAGLEIGDIITAVDGQEINTISDLTTVINSHQSGETVDITYWRGQSETTVSLVLGESPVPQQ
jgi:serine protease Do